LGKERNMPDEQKQPPPPPSPPPLPSPPPETEIYKEKRKGEPFPPGTDPDKGQRLEEQ